MKIYEELNRLKKEALVIIRNMTIFMRELYPLNNVRFMNEEEKMKYNEYYERITKISNRYNSLYARLSRTEKQHHEHINIMGKFDETLYQLPSLISQESENTKLNQEDVLSIVRRVVKRKISSEAANDIVTVNKCNRVLDCCKDAFSEQLKGFDYDDYIVSFEDRVRSGRLTDDDINEYQALVEEARKFAITYAKELVNGLSIEDNDSYIKTFDKMIAKGKELTRFLSLKEKERINPEIIEWFKIEVLDNPKKFITDNDALSNTK